MFFSFYTAFWDYEKDGDGTGGKGRQQARLTLACAGDGSM